MTMYITESAGGTEFHQLESAETGRDHGGVNELWNRRAIDSDEIICEWMSVRCGR